ncbi:MAG TPA: invasion associated locus B family protein [Beijerinckiaceae bacterium]|nr:invasion associated locus B family protein [Beijerinckiaceae bacterium]
MSLLNKRIAAALACSLLMCAGGAAQARPKRPVKAVHPAAAAPAQAAPQPQGPIRVVLQPTQPNWTKVCGKDQVAKKEICYTTRDFGQAPNQPPVLALAVYDVKGDPIRIVRLLLPVSLMLEPGFRFSIDKGAAQAGKFEICFPNGCFAQSKIRPVTLESLKKGTMLNVSVKNQVNNDVTFGVPLAGFGKAFDGKPIDPKVLAAQQKQLQDQLQKRAEAERKRIEAQQAGTAAAPGAAPAIPGSAPTIPGGAPVAPAAPAPAPK